MARGVKNLIKHVTSTCRIRKGLTAKPKTDIQLCNINSNRPQPPKKGNNFCRGESNVSPLNLLPSLSEQYCWCQGSSPPHLRPTPGKIIAQIPDVFYAMRRRTKRRMAIMSLSPKVAFSSRKKTNAFRRGSAGPVFQTRKIKYLKSNKIGQDAKADGRSLRRYSGPGKHKQARSNRLGDRISRKRPHSSWSERAQHGHYLTTGESKTRCGYLRFDENEISALTLEEFHEMISLMEVRSENWNLPGVEEPLLCTKRNPKPENHKH
ncbi:hypothetical protein RUM44_013536 [Polyplax serrata]|uniref:Uncharacterized protein n=1 Tax=Polyplax serrata TaxID=468196 RepID=A0ABR1BI24_POLSC